MVKHIPCQADRWNYYERPTQMWSDASLSRPFSAEWWRIRNRYIAHCHHSPFWLGMAAVRLMQQSALRRHTVKDRLIVDGNNTDCGWLHNIVIHSYSLLKKETTQGFTNAVSAVYSNAVSVSQCKHTLEAKTQTMKASVTSSKRKNWSCVRSFHRAEQFSDSKDVFHICPQTSLRSADWGAEKQAFLVF